MQEFYDDDSDYNKIEDDFKDRVFTHLRLNPLDVGKIKDIKEGYARTEFLPIANMSVDEHKLLFTGYIFNAANYAAMLALNEENVILSPAKVVFLLPIKIDEELIFEAISKHKESKKKMVKVVGTQQGVKFFEGEFATLRYDSHVLDIKLYDRDEHDK